MLAWRVCREMAVRADAPSQSRSGRPAAPSPSVSRTLVRVWLGSPIRYWRQKPSPYRSNGPSGAASPQPVAARGDSRTALQSPECRDRGPPGCRSAMTHKSLSHKSPACAIMRQNFSINPCIRGLISTFIVERSGRIYGPMSIYSRVELNRYAVGF
jgi:hypothetical protein